MTTNTTRYSCRFTGIKFLAACMLQTAQPDVSCISSLHPALCMLPAQVLQMPHSFLQLAAMMYKLHLEGFVQYKSSHAFHASCSAENATMQLVLLRTCKNLMPVYKAVTSGALAAKGAPKLHMHHSTLQELQAYIGSLQEVLENNKHWEQVQEQQQEAKELLAETRKEQEARVAQKMQFSKVLQSTAMWASEVLTIRCTSWGQQAHNTLLAVLSGKTHLAAARRMRDTLLDFLPEEKLQDAIRKEALVQGIDDIIASTLASFGSNDMLSPEEREHAATLLSRYSFAPVAQGGAGSTVPASVQALQAMVNTPHAAPVAPERGAYATTMSYLIALAAYNARVAGTAQV